MSEKWFVASVLKFSDGGEPSIMMLARGVEDEKRCEYIASTIPAITYSGERPVEEARIIWGPESELVEPGSAK